MLKRWNLVTVMKRWTKMTINTRVGLSRKRNERRVKERRRLKTRLQKWLTGS